MLSRAASKLSAQQIHKCLIRHNSNVFPNQAYSSLPSRNLNHISSHETKSKATVEIPINSSCRIEGKKLFSTAVAADDMENAPMKTKKKPRRRLKLDAITVVRETKHL